MTPQKILDELGLLADADRAAHAQAFFKTAPGEYGEGDLFLGIRVPDVRKLARRVRGLPLADVQTLLDSRWHEARLLAVVLLSDAFARATLDHQREIAELYLRKRDRINNWDLVDASAHKIIGPFLDETGDQSVLDELAGSSKLWDRRIAMLSTLWFTRQGDLGPALRVAELLVDDAHDLMHKAVGWMLREVGKRDKGVEEAFLDHHAATMPRTMLRYAIERFPETQRQHYLVAAAQLA